MKADIKITNPDAIEATITLTMTLESWRQLHSDLKENPFYRPALDLRCVIDKLTDAARMTFSLVEGEAPNE